MSSITVNIPAAGLGSRPPSVVSTGTLDEGGFNEPFPEIKARLRPHEGSPKNETESGSREDIEALYAKPNKLRGLSQQTSSDSGASQVTVIAQKSFDSDVMYNSPKVITNSVLAELESQEEEDVFVGEKSEPFLLKRESLQTEKITAIPDVQKLEANILDLNDVDYADASDNEDGCGEKSKIPEADTMTPAEAENLLSSQ